jgi:plasmid stability protein
MPAKTLTVAVPEPLLKQLRSRARRGKRTVEAELLKLIGDAVSADDETPANGAGHRRNGRHKAAGPKEDEPLTPDIESALAEIRRLDDAGVRRLAKDVLSTKEVRRLEALNRKAQKSTLTAAEEKQRAELSHSYEKALVVRSAAIAELHNRGVDVAELIAP